MLRRRRQQRRQKKKKSWTYGVGVVDVSLEGGVEWMSRVSPGGLRCNCTVVAHSVNTHSISPDTRPLEKCPGTVLVVPSDTHADPFTTGHRGTTTRRESRDRSGHRGTYAIATVTRSLVVHSVRLVSMPSSRYSHPRPSRRPRLTLRTGIARRRVRPPQQTRDLAYRSHPLKNPSCCP